MTAANVRVSLVIPAYNEERHLRACLQAVARQTVRPYEVIVVDNNSTDSTVAVARDFHFVRVVREPRQGVVFARNAGFDAASGDVIGRIDADTRLPIDWIAQVQRIFADSDIGAASGPVGFYDAPFARFFAKVDLSMRCFMARPLMRRNEMFLYGSNMAVRQTMWQDLRTRVCSSTRQHEDTDLAAHAAHGSWHIVFERRLQAAISARRINDPDLWSYALANSRTYRQHGLRSRFYMYPVAFTILFATPLLRLLYKSYNPATGKMSFSRLFRTNTKSRVSPVAETL